MRVLIALVVALISTPFVAWWGTVAICSAPSLKFSNLCGHNAYIPLFLLGLAAFVTIAVLVHRLVRQPKASVNE